MNPCIKWKDYTYVTMETVITANSYNSSLQNDSEQDTFPGTSTYPSLSRLPCARSLEGESSTVTGLESPALTVIFVSVAHNTPKHLKSMVKRRLGVYPSMKPAIFIPEKLSQRVLMGCYPDLETVEKLCILFDVKPIKLKPVR